MPNKINWCFKQIVIPLFLVAILTVSASGQDTKGDKVLARGDGYEFTMKRFEAYRETIAPNNKNLDNMQLLIIFLRNDLFSREYARKNNKPWDDLNSDDKASIEQKMRYSRQYVQQVLADYAVPEDAIESYYLSYPEKFKSADAASGNAAVVSLNDDLKNEIKFQIVEKKKNMIIKEAAKKLMERDHIKIISEKF